MKYYFLQNKKLAIFSFFLAFSLVANAQFDTKDQHIEVYLSAGGTYFKPVWKDLDVFTNSYNSYYGNQLSQQFQPFQAAFAPRLELGLGLGNSIDIGLAYTFPASYSTAAEFQSKERRELKLVTSQTEVRFAMNFFHIGKVFFGGHMAALFVDGKMYSGYRYTNDFLSYGQEKRLNAIFRTNHTQLSGGAQIYWTITKQLALTAHWESVGFLNETTVLGNRVLGIKDFFDGYGTTYSNHQYTTYLPMDFEQSNNAAIYLVGNGEKVRPEYSGNRYLLTLRYNLWVLDEIN